MRSGSEAALQRAHDRWDGLLEARAGEELELGLQIFSLVDILRASSSLENALETRSRDADARAELAKRVLAGRVADEVTELTMGVVREQWSEQGDLCRALEHLGIHAVLAHARQQSRLGSVEEQLYQAVRLLVDQRDLRLAFTSVTRSVEARQALAEKIFALQDPATVALIKRAIARDDRTIASWVRDYIDAAAAMSDHLVAAVTAALPLTREQEERLTALLSAKYNTDVRIHVALDTSVIGGLRIHVNDDVIDGTLASRLKTVRGAFTSN